MSRARMADQGAQHNPAQHVPQTSNSKKKGFSPMKLVSAVLLIAVTILVLAMLAFLIFGGSKPESELIKEDQYQAIFLNDQSGQVYFGKLSIVNSRLYRLTDIYYVRVENAVQPDRTGNSATQQNIILPNSETSYTVLKTKCLSTETRCSSGKTSRMMVRLLLRLLNSETMVEIRTTRTPTRMVELEPAQAQAHNRVLARKYQYQQRYNQHQRNEQYAEHELVHLGSDITLESPPGLYF